MKKTKRSKALGKQKLKLKKSTIERLTPEQLDRARGGQEAYSDFASVWCTMPGCPSDTCAVACTQYNCGYSYRNCPA